MMDEVLHGRGIQALSAFVQRGHEALQPAASIVGVCREGVAPVVHTHSFQLGDSKRRAGVGGGEGLAPPLRGRPARREDCESRQGREPRRARCHGGAAALSPVALAGPISCAPAVAQTAGAGTRLPLPPGAAASVPDLPSVPRYCRGPSSASPAADVAAALMRRVRLAEGDSLSRDDPCDTERNWGDGDAARLSRNSCRIRRTVPLVVRMNTQQVTR